MPTCKNGHVLTEQNIYYAKEKKKDGTLVIRNKCADCRKINRKKITDSFHEKPIRAPTLEELARASEKLISWSNLARECGVTDTAIRKRAKRLGFI